MLPLAEFPVEEQERIAAAVALPRPPSKFLDLRYDNGRVMASIISRSWYEWHHQRGRDPFKRRVATPRPLRNELARRSGCSSVNDGRVDVGCFYCGAPGQVWWEPDRRVDARIIYGQARSTLQVDHVIPVAHGGRHFINNVVWACRPCNRAKGTQSADEFAALLNRGAE